MEWGRWDDSLKNRLCRLFGGVIPSTAPPPRDCSRWWKSRMRTMLASWCSTDSVRLFVFEISGAADHTDDPFGRNVVISLRNFESLRVNPQSLWIERETHLRDCHFCATPSAEVKQHGIHYLLTREAQEDYIIHVLLVALQWLPNAEASGDSVFSSSSCWLPLQR